MKLTSASLLTARPGALLVSVFALSALAGGCGSAQTGGSDSGGKKKGLFAAKCTTPTNTAPELEAPEPITFPKSRVWVHGAIPTSDAVSALTKEVPHVLANEKNRDVGAPGKATFKVTRGTPSLHQLTEGLEVRVPISADISVCKGIGAMCIKYGSCSPRLEARFSVANTVGDNYEWAPPKGTISATRRCVIGIDVTNEIEKQARIEVAKVQAEIAREWPEVKSHAGVLWRQLAQPIRLDEQTCVNMAPSEMAYLPPHIHKANDGDIVKAAYGIVGEVLPANKCKRRKPGKLPQPTVKKNPPKESRMWFPEKLTKEHVQGALRSSIEGVWVEGENVKVLDVKLAKNTVALQLESDGSVCGTFWVRGSLSHEAGSDSLKLAGVEPVGEQEDAAALKPLLKAIQGRATVPVQSEEWFSEQALQPIRHALMKNLDKNIDFRIKKLQAEDARVRVADDGIYVLHPLVGRFVIAGF